MYTLCYESYCSRDTTQPISCSQNYRGRERWRNTNDDYFLACDLIASSRNFSLLFVILFDCVEQVAECDEQWRTSWLNNQPSGQLEWRTNTQADEKRKNANVMVIWQKIISSLVIGSCWTIHLFVCCWFYDDQWMRHWQRDFSQCLSIFVER